MPTPTKSLVPVCLFQTIVGPGNHNFDFVAAGFGLMGSVSVINLGPDAAFASFNVAIAPAAALGNGIFPLAANQPYNAEPVSVSNVWVSVAGGATANVCVTGIPRADVLNG